MNPRNKTSRSALACLAAAACAALSPARASAQEEPEALIRQGVELRRRGEDARAHGYFERAYHIARTPRSAAQLGLAEQALGYFADAHEHLGEALASHDAWVNENRDLLERSRATVETHLGRVRLLGGPAGTTVRVRDQVRERAPAPLPVEGSVWVAPGTVRLTFEAPARAAVTKELVIAAGEKRDLDVDLGPAPAAAPSLPRTAVPADTDEPRLSLAQDGTVADRRRVWRVAGLGLVGAGLAAGVTGGILYASGAAKLGAINSDAGGGRPYDPSNDNYQTLGNVGTGLIIAGGLAIAAGVGLYLLNRIGGGRF